MCKLDGIKLCPSAIVCRCIGVWVVEEVCERVCFH